MGLLTVQGYGMYDTEGGATAGAPGSFAIPPGGTVPLIPANFADLQGATATPATQWSAGQYVLLGDGSRAWWDATLWRIGTAQQIIPVFTAQSPPATGVSTVAYGPYSFTATGTATINFTVTAGSGSLPTGLALSTAGVLNGTPTVPGVYVFKVSATNPAGATVTGNKTITIS